MPAPRSSRQLGHSVDSGYDDGRLGWSRSREDADQAFDAVIGSVPSPIFAKLAPDCPDDYRSKLLSLDYEAAVVVLLEMDRALSTIYWMNIADPAYALHRHHRAYELRRTRATTTANITSI